MQQRTTESVLCHPVEWHRRRPKSKVPITAGYRRQQAFCRQPTGQLNLDSCNRRAAWNIKEPSVSVRRNAMNGQRDGRSINVYLVIRLDRFSPHATRWNRYVDCHEHYFLSVVAANRRLYRLLNFDWICIVLDLSLNLFGRAFVPPLAITTKTKHRPTAKTAETTLPTVGEFTLLI